SACGWIRPFPAPSFRPRRSASSRSPSPAPSLLVACAGYARVSISLDLVREAPPMTLSARLAGSALALPLVLVAFCVLSIAPAAFGALPPNFTDEQVTTVAGPTGFDFTPDGRLLVARQAGELIVRQGTTNTSAVTFPASQIC